MTLCRPASQVALLACVLVPLVARRGARRIAAGVVVSLAAAVIPLGAWAAHNAVRYDDFTVARGGKAWVPFFRVGGAVEAERRRVEAARERRRARGAAAAAVRKPRRRRPDVLPASGTSR